MAKLRPARAYRRLERPYTRKSRKRQKSYVKASPHSKVVHYHMGDVKKEFPVIVKLISESDVQIRHNAIEAARVTANKMLNNKLSGNYHFWIRIYPHHILRENPLATGAGADRFQTGMKHAFGKPIGLAAQVHSGDEVMEVQIDEANIELAKKALKKAANKIPGKMRVIVEYLK